MKIYPAIDIIDGNCVRLVQGDYSQKTKFADDPKKVAKRFVEQGGEFIHIVDLDGARSGSTPNMELITGIANSVDVPIEVGGGIRNMQTVEQYLENGVHRVIIGTAALENDGFVEEAVKKYGDRIAVGIDAKDGMAAVSGWEKVSRVSALELAKKMQEIGVKYIIYTDIATDGMLKGPNVSAMEEMVKTVPDVNIIASGGVSCIDDIKELLNTGVEGVIVGKALYTDRVNLTEAVAVSR